MGHSYPLSNFIHQLCVAQRNYKPTFTYKICSNFILDNVRFLMRVGLISNYELLPHPTLKNVQMVKLDLRYSNTRQPLILDVRTFTRPGHTVILSLKDIQSLHRRSLRYTIGFYVFSTSDGLKTDTECIRQQLSGGKLLYSINLET